MFAKMEDSWAQILKNEFDQPYFKKLEAFLIDAYQTKKDQIFPEQKLVFEAFNACPFDSVKVVILGQDPYPTKGHANGLCFSVSEGVKPFPKSLLNIFKELETDLNCKSPNSGNLKHWAKQGVLMLNTVLTVEEGKADSHARKGWELFTDAVIQSLNNEKEGLVYILWGSKAQEKAKDVDANKNLILKSVHPSPLSSYRGFFGSKPFCKTNEYLEQKGKSIIQW